jgi:cobalamin biosynthesis Mg chelatase CobN
VGSRSKGLRRGVVALACVVVAAAAAGPAAAEGPPRPERSPSPGVAPVRPEAAPSASAAQSTQKTYSSYQGSTYQGPSTGSSTYVPPANSRPAVTPPRTSHVRAAKTPVHRTAKKDPPASLPTKPVKSIASTGGQILVTSAHGLTKAPSSSESLLLLLVGLALVVLVVGETTFLRLAARGPAPQRAAEEPLPIRQVQLRR